MTVAKAARGTLALLGGGEFDAACAEIDTQLLSLSGGSDVLVVPAAAAFEMPERVIKKAVDYFASIGAAAHSLPVLNRRDAEDDALVKVAKSAKFVYFTDGSPMHLRSVLKDTSLLNVLVAGYRNGSVLAASGAAATVLCDPMVDSRGGAYTVGLGVAENLAVFPHHTNMPDHLWDRSIDMLPDDARLAGVDDHTALVRDGDGSWRVVGVGAVTVFIGGEARRCVAGAIEGL